MWRDKTKTKKPLSHEGSLTSYHCIVALWNCQHLIDQKYQGFHFQLHLCWIYNLTFSLASGRYDSDLLKLKWWSKSYLAADNAEEDIRLSLSVPSLDVDTHYGTEECLLTDITKREFSCLRFHITFYRCSFYVQYFPLLLLFFFTFSTLILWYFTDNIIRMIMSLSVKKM